MKVSCLYKKFSYQNRSFLQIERNRVFFIHDFKPSKISIIRNEKDVTKDASDIKEIIRNDYEELYANKLQNLDKMDEFLENINIPKLI